MALHFELVTPAKLVRSEDVHMVVVPGTEGEFGVLEGHAPFMSTIRDGAVQVYKTEGSAPELIEVRGGFAEYALMNVDQVIPKPEKLSWEQAAAVPISFITAYEMITMYGRLKAGETLLVMGASSGAGVASIQIGKIIGARTIGTSGSQQKLDKLKTIGLDIGIATRKPDFAEAVMKATDGKGVDLIINGVGGSVFAECLRTLAFRGRLATVGYVDNVFKAEIDLNAVHASRLEIFGVSNARLPASGKALSTAGFVRDVLPAIADGRIVPLVDRVYSFDELPAAKDCMESSAMVGKIVIRIN